MTPESTIAALPSLPPARIDALLRHRWGRLVVPSLLDLLFIALIGWLFMSSGPHGWQSLLADADVGWHIRTGEYILDHHQVPHQDLYSFSKPGAPWFAWEWLSDVIDALLFRWAGLKGVVLAAGVLIALFATFLIDAVLQEKLVWASFWLGAVILPIKPHWAFALAMPLLLGRYRFFLQLLLGAVFAYLIVAGTTILAGGFEYGIRQYQDYLGFLTRLTRDYPWWGPDKPFLGYNHSIMQIVLYYLGVSAANMRLATLLKLILLLPLGWIGLKFLRNPIKKAGSEVPETALALVFAFYLGAFIWLDMVWELSLGVVIFAYLLATSEQRWMRVLLWIVFGPYALLDIWRLISYLGFGDRVLYQGAYVLTDPLLYIPWIMILLLVFYAILLSKLNRLSVKPV